MRKLILTAVDVLEAAMFELETANRYTSRAPTRSRPPEVATARGQP